MDTMGVREDIVVIDNGLDEDVVDVVGNIQLLRGGDPCGGRVTEIKLLRREASGNHRATASSATPRKAMTSCSYRPHNT